MVERVLSMHEAPGSIPGTSSFLGEVRNLFWVLTALDASSFAKNVHRLSSFLVLLFSSRSFKSHKKNYFVFNMDPFLP